MTTQLIRSTMRFMSDAGIDPTELQWFDATGMFQDKTHVGSDPLLECRPPFEKCMVVFQGKTTSGRPMEMFMTVVGKDPEEGIVLSVWRAPAGGRPISSPVLVYAVDGGLVRYGAADENEKIEEKEAQMILGFVAAWYKSISQKCQSHKPVARDTFTNRRKIQQGKLPTYDWTTVYIEPVKARSEDKGGTHASPRLHDRRGHLRRLRNGTNVWVKPCKVGDPLKGAVFHDYAIKSEPA